MELLPPFDVPALLRRYNLRPDKGLGQNFLVDDSALREITMIAGTTPDDTVLEIGPGMGSLTRYLASSSKRVVAVELDERFTPILNEVLLPYSNVHLVEGDILALNPADLISRGDYLVVANIPYYITTALIRHLLEASHPPKRIILTVQEEVGLRICAHPGKMSLLSLSVQVYGEPQISARIPAGSFYPVPKVDSAVIRIDLFSVPRIPSADLDLFFRLAKAGFSQKRKTLRNALSAGMRWETGEASDILISAGIDPQRRAETLSLQEWGGLVSVLTGSTQG